MRVSPSRATKGLSDRPLETFGLPLDERILACLLEERFFPCSKVYLSRMQTEGVQGKRTAQWAVAEGEFPERSGGGPTGKPPGCSGKTTKQVSDKTLCNSSGVRRTVAAHGLHRSDPETGRPREAFEGNSPQ